MCGWVGVYVCVYIFVCVWVYRHKSPTHPK